VPEQQLQEADVDDHATGELSHLEKAHLWRTLHLGNDRIALYACGELPFDPFSLHRNRATTVAFPRWEFAWTLARERSDARLASREKTIACYFFFPFFADFFAFFAPFFALFLAAMTIFRPFSAFADSF